MKFWQVVDCGLKIAAEFLQNFALFSLWIVRDGKIAFNVGSYGRAWKNLKLINLEMTDYYQTCCDELLDN